jgi:hypothetical protein
MKIIGANVTGSFILNSQDVTTTIQTSNVWSGSVATDITALNAATASLNRVTSSLLNYTASNNAAISDILLETASINTFTSSIDNRTSVIEGKYITTGSNTFVGVQYVSNTTQATTFTSTASLYTDGGLRIGKDAYVSGSAFIKGNLTVFGTSSIEYVTSSVFVGLEYIDLNTDLPALRYAGIRVYDSGSNVGVTGSLFWDSQTNHWVYANPSGSSYSGGMLISGPRASSLGEEQGTTFNALMKGMGGDHITSSGIFENGLSASFYNNALVVSASGDNRFGSLLGNTHTFTGSVNITGSQTISNGDLTISGNRNIFLSNANTAAGVIRFYNSTSGSTKSGIGSYYNIADEGNLEFLTGGTTTRMIINSLGNVGIATTTIPNNLGVAMQMGPTLNLMSYVGNSYFLNNWYYDSSGNAKYITSNFASGITQNGSGELRFFTNPSGTANATFTPTERIVITNGGNVGIGTTNPSNLLQTKDVGITNTNTYFGTGQVRIGGGSDHTTNTVLSVAPGVVSFDAPGVGGGRFTINSSGNIGIGTASPATSYGFTRFLVISNPTNAEISLEATTSGKVLSMGVTNGWNYFQTTAGNGYDFQIGGTSRMQISSTGAISTSSTISAGGNVSMAQFSANALFSSYTPDGLFNVASRYSAISTPGAADRIRFGYNDYGSGQYWGRIGFNATTNWSLGIITGAGNDFSIGTGYQGSQLYIYSNGNYAFSGSNVSDRRKKANINYITSNQLDNILKLKPATFNKIADEVVSENVHTGFIAQDIMEEGIPNLVMGSDEGGYGLDYDGILALTVKAIQELKAENDTLKEILQRNNIQ